MENGTEHKDHETQAASAGQHQPGRYEIRLQGHLDEQWAGWFEGMIITREALGETRLSGPVVDQAALHGLLKKVRDLGMPLLSVHRLDLNPTDASDGQAANS